MRTSLLSGFATLVLLTSAGPASAQTAPPIASLSDLVVRTIQACRDEQDGKGMLFVSAQKDLGFGGSFAFGFFREIEGQKVRLEIQKDGCRLSFANSPAPFATTVDALAVQSRTWTHPQQLYDNRISLKKDDGDSLRSFIGWQSKDKKHMEALIVDEPDPTSTHSREGYIVAYGWFEQ